MLAAAKKKASKRAERGESLSDPLRAGSPHPCYDAPVGFALLHWLHSVTFCFVSGCVLHEPWLEAGWWERGPGGQPAAEGIPSLRHHPPRVNLAIVNESIVPSTQLRPHSGLGRHSCVPWGPLAAKGASSWMH